MTPPSPRRALLDNSLLYFFSYDVELDTNRDEIGLVPSGARVNVFCRPNESRIYHVVRDNMNSSSGLPRISGQVVWGGDYALIREDDVAVSDVRMTIRTDDGAVIDSTYRAMFPLGPGGYRDFISEEHRIGTFKKPADYPIVITPTYETASSTYRWLTERQCVGIGNIRVIKNRARRVTYDIYGMD